MIEELAKDYSNYCKVDIKGELHVVEETIDDMLTRLEEFENLVNMVRMDRAVCVDTAIPQILSCKEKLNSLCDRIDRLEEFVDLVKSDMDVVEARVTEAETDVGSQNSGKFKNIFKPLFFKKSAETQPKRPAKTPTYEAPVLFNTESFFPQTELSK